MSERSIASRPSTDQVMAIVDFMEKHRSLALGKLRGLEGRDESKKLWSKLSRIVNNMTGPTRPMKSWIKFWADKKSAVRSKVITGGGDSNSLCSNIEKRIWDLFLANVETTKSHNSVKVESHYMEEPYFTDEADQSHDAEPELAFDEPPLDFEERQMAVMEKLVKVMSEQVPALLELATASNINAQAMERIAEASQIQARALERLANSFESIGAATRDVRDAMVDIDSTMKRFYNTAPT